MAGLDGWQHRVSESIHETVLQLEPRAQLAPNSRTKTGASSVVSMLHASVFLAAECGLGRHPQSPPRKIDVSPGRAEDRTAQRGRCSSTSRQSPGLTAKRSRDCSPVDAP